MDTQMEMEMEHALQAPACQKPGHLGRQLLFRLSTSP